VRGRERGAAAVLLVFGLLALEEARKLRVGSIARPGPGFFPLVLAAAFSLVCVALLVNALRVREAEAPPGAPLGWPKIVGAMAALFVYALLLEAIGFVAATFALLLFFFKTLERQRWVPAVAGALVTALVTYLVFKVWLNVQLPAGPWGG
jgi:putative tricarboxylic transport membrane protein